MTRHLLLVSLSALQAVTSFALSSSSSFNDSLHKPFGYNHTEATFGTPDFGHQLTAGVKWVDADLCDGPPDGLADGQAFILMFRRGDCHFVRKVRNAQLAGAAAAVIVNWVCLCGDPDCTDGNAPCDQALPTMADDGSGGDVNIPSVMILKQDGEAIAASITSGAPTVASIAWRLPTPDDRVEWELWTNPIDWDSEDLKLKWRPVQSALGKHAFFTPNFVLVDGRYLGCVDGTPSGACADQCTNAGRYCSPDPDFQLNRGLSGADVVKVSLMQKCIWNVVGGDPALPDSYGIGLKWWAFLEDFIVQCNDLLFRDPSCAEVSMIATEIDKDKVNACMDLSGGVTDNVNNTILDDELSRGQAKGAFFSPTLFVNEVIERGAPEPPVVLSAICAGYAAGTEPDVCACDGVDASQFDSCVQNDGTVTASPTQAPVSRSSSSEKGLSGGEVAAIVISMLVVCAAAIYGYYVYSQKRIRNEVRDILAEYMPLDDSTGVTENEMV